MGRVLADSTARWNDLTLRVVSALVLMPVAIGCVWVGGAWFLLLILLLAAGLASEWLGLCGFDASRRPGLALTPVLIVAVLLAALGTPRSAVACLASAAAMAMMTLPPQPVRAGAEHMPGLGWLAVPNLAFAVGFPYLGSAAVALAWLRAGPHGLANTLFLLSIIWASDIGAYVVGRLVGGPKLVPAISPGKTRSGAIGGLIAAVAAGLTIAACFSSDFSPSHVVLKAIFLGLVSQAGDLVESAIKRHFGVKDSGAMIPGHGGLLDRLDSLLTVAPAGALLSLAAGQGEVLWR